MTGSKRIREAIVVALLVVLAGLTLRQSKRHPGEVSVVDRGILFVATPGQAALASVARSAGGMAGRYVDLVHVRGENETLRTDNARLQAELMEARRLAGETARLQRLLGLRDQVPAETLAARIVAMDTSPHFRVASIKLDRGEGFVRRGMPVITPDGVVGRIRSVAGGVSTVLLAVDPESAFDVILPRSGGRGILRGKAGENGYRCAIEYLARGEPAQEGDVVVTSGLGSFPRDMPVGKVAKVKQTSGLYQQVEVTPAVDFARLAEVLVVVSPPPPPPPAREEGSPPRGGPPRGATPTQGLVNR